MGGGAKRSLKRTRQLEKKVEALTNCKTKFERMKVRYTSPGHDSPEETFTTMAPSRFGWGGSSPSFSRIFTPGQASSTDDLGFTLPASDGSTFEGLAAELED